MAIPDDAGHYVVSGTSPGGEGFAFGWWVHDVSHSFGANLDLSTAWGTFRTALNARMTTQQSITQYDYYRYASGVVSYHDQSSVAHAGTGTSGQLPLQVACVLTTRTATLSRRGRGRLYLPTSDFSMMSGSGNLFSSTVVNTLVDDFAAYLTSIATGSDHPVVVSRAGSVMEVITSVDADYVPDTQRRRRGKLTSARHSHSV